MLLREPAFWQVRQNNNKSGCHAINVEIETLPRAGLQARRPDCTRLKVSFVTPSGSGVQCSARVFSGRWEGQGAPGRRSQGARPSLVVNVALGLLALPAADVNLDGAVNALDIQIVINAALGLYG
jgi:hypothetical protein